MPPSARTHETAGTPFFILRSMFPSISMRIFLLYRPTSAHTIHRAVPGSVRRTASACGSLLCGAVRLRRKERYGHTMNRNTNNSKRRAVGALTVCAATLTALLLASCGGNGSSDTGTSTSKPSGTATAPVTMPSATDTPTAPGTTEPSATDSGTPSTTPGTPTDTDTATAAPGSAAGRRR